ncbi:MAG TPA: hypothetical protein VFZ65_04725 [Planctomycetota bacterium]|nr:hypothetical protein [Planctomycetota bacterium]
MAAKSDPYRHAKLLVEDGLLGRRFLPFQEILRLLMVVADYAHRRSGFLKEVSFFRDGQDDYWRIRELADANLSNTLHALDLGAKMGHRIARPWLRRLRVEFDPQRVRVGRLHRSTAVEGLLDMADWVIRKADRELKTGGIQDPGAKCLSALRQQLCFEPDDPWEIINKLYAEKQTLERKFLVGAATDPDEWGHLGTVARRVLTVIHGSNRALTSKEIWFKATARKGRASGRYREVLTELSARGLLVEEGLKRDAVFSAGRRPNGMPTKQATQ